MKKISQWLRDLVCSHSIAAGGDLAVEGDARFQGNVTIHGWLRAPNVQGPCVGLFADSAQLTRQFPKPHNGWWALVGDTVPAEVFRASGGAWSATGATGGVPVIDAPLYDARISALGEQLAALQTSLDTLAANPQLPGDTAAELAALQELATQLQEQAASLQRQLADTDTAVDQNREYVTALSERVSALGDTLADSVHEIDEQLTQANAEIGKLDTALSGFAALAQEAKNRSLDDFAPYEGTCDEAFYWWSEAPADLEPVRVAWNTPFCRFVALDSEGRWHTRWEGAAQYQDYYEDTLGRMQAEPHARRLYLDTAAGTLCRYCGEELLPINTLPV